MTVDYDFLPESTHLLQLEQPRGAPRCGSFSEASGLHRAGRGYRFGVSLQ